ncbi:phosphatidylinositol N-acetylglucosaminyltransferase [Clavulina sp. PMI_390]|nr:phosphatidylinositol N-acetylglucosaminyltransferase [Clavulina sp. PMI_390]
MKWEKVLWKEQPFPDNYVPPAFLSSLRRNTNVRKHTYLSLLIAALPITQHAATVFLFIAVFIHLLGGALDPRFLLWGCIVGYLSGMLLAEAIFSALGEAPASDDIGRKQQRSKTVKASLLVFLALMALTPILKTLTEATSSDSIWALAFVLFFLNVLLADYGRGGPSQNHLHPSHHSPRTTHPQTSPTSTESNTSHARSTQRRTTVEPRRLTSVLSMNAAISASVVLASRLRSHLAVFALVLLAVLLFALGPGIRQRLQKASITLQVTTTIVVAFSAVVTFSFASHIGSILVFATLAFLTFFCPMLLVWAQRYKNEIRGPWDPAVPVLNVKET